MNQSTPRLKTISRISIIILLMIFSNSLFAQQTNETEYQPWKLLVETSKQLEVSGRVVKCNNNTTPQLFLQVFNENPAAQLAHFNITLKNPITLIEVVQEISINMSGGLLAKPLCEDTTYSSLRLNIPDGWDPSTVQFTLTLIP